MGVSVSRSRRGFQAAARRPAGSPLPPAYLPCPALPVGHAPAQVDIVQRRVDLMAAEGVRFVTSAHVGKEVDIKAIRASSDAVVLAAGATKPRDLPIDGRWVLALLRRWRGASRPSISFRLHGALPA